eukprot:gene13426-28471_t
MKMNCVVKLTVLLFSFTYGFQQWASSSRLLNKSTYKMAGSSRLMMSKSEDDKANLVARLLNAKASSEKTFDEIAAGLGMTNVYTVQLFMNQAQLKPETAEKLSKLVPAITSDDLLAMQSAPFRSFDPQMLQEPLVYRLIEAMQHYGKGIKQLVNEKLGDGIISAIDLYVTLDTVKGVTGEDRVVLTLNGKFLPFIEQIASKNTAARK